MRTDYFDDLLPAGIGKATGQKPAAAATSGATARDIEQARALGYRVIMRGLDVTQAANHTKAATG